MVYELNFNRQIALWGQEGQDLIKDSTLLVVGAQNFGREVVKSASILGVGKIYIMDNYRAYENNPFLDIPFGEGKSASRMLRDIIPSTLNPECDIVAMHSRCSSQRLNSIDDRIDFILDVSNNPESQHYCLDFSSKRRIPILLSCVSDIGGIISDPRFKEKGAQKEIDGFYGTKQGIIMSNIFAGILVEEFRKTIFLRNKSVFKNTKIMQRDGSTLKYIQEVEKERPMMKDIHYSIIGDDRLADPRKIGNYLSDGTFAGVNLVVLGGGALGNYFLDITARLHPSTIDIVDFDTFEGHNLNRQPLGYGKVGQKKCQVLSERIKKISLGHTESRYIYGKVANTLTNEEKRKGYSLLDGSWFSKNRYDVVVGCFDNQGVRSLMNGYAVKNGFVYLDGGSTPKSSRANLYFPGKTNCLNCSISIDNMARARESDESKKKEADDAERRRNALLHNANVRGLANVSCAHVQGSINMSNQTGAGLLVSLLRQALDPDYGKLVDSVNYSGNSYDRLQVSGRDLICKCT
jgi:molybdopterin/thiamine biosynthesis adenylyltransferase